MAQAETDSGRSGADGIDILTAASPGMLTAEQADRLAATARPGRCRCLHRLHRGPGGHRDAYASAAGPAAAAGPRVRRVTAIGAVALGATAGGAAVGALWAWLAPPVHGVVALTRDGERVRAYLGNEGENFFVAPVLTLGLLAVLAVVVAVAAWQWQPHRGPGMAAGLPAGLVAAATLAALVGAELAHRRYGVADVEAAPVTPDHRLFYYVEAPPVFFGHSPPQAAVTLLLPAAAAALVYALCVALAARDDLSGHRVALPRSPAAEPPAAPTAGVIADDGVPLRR